MTNFVVSLGSKCDFWCIFMLFSATETGHILKFVIICLATSFTKQEIIAKSGIQTQFF